MKGVRRTVNIFLRILLPACVIPQLIGCASMTPGSLEAVRINSDKPHAGNVYLLRGWIGIFSYGINNLRDEIDHAGIRANVYQDDQWAPLADAIEKKYAHANTAEPLILIGHSFGADDVLRMCRHLAKSDIPIDLVITLDAVSPPELPANVRRCVNIYQSNGAWDKVPAFRGVALHKAPDSSAELVNVDVRVDRIDLLEPGTNHFNIEKNEKIHQEVLRQLAATCPDRTQWSAMKPAAQQLAAKPTTQPSRQARFSDPVSPPNQVEAIGHDQTLKLKQ
jgi:predicted esterase